MFLNNFIKKIKGYFKKSKEDKNYNIEKALNMARKEFLVQYDDRYEDIDEIDLDSDAMKSRIEEISEFENFEYGQIRALEQLLS